MGKDALVLSKAVPSWAPQMQGGAQALKWALRDLPHLDRIMKHVPHRRVAVQAGGCLGVYPKQMAATFAHVYTFEPAGDLFRLLCVNAPEPNISRFQAALGDRHSFVDVARVRRDGKTNIHEGITHISGEGPIPTLRIDDFQFPVCDLIQLDLEGWELYALRGASATLARCRPVVAVEINKSCGFVGIDPNDVRNMVLSHGYRFVEQLSADEVFVPMEWQ